MFSRLTNQDQELGGGDKYAAFKELSIDTDQSESLPPLESFSAQPIKNDSSQPISGLDSFTSQNLEPNGKPLTTSFSLSAVIFDGL